MSLNKKLLNTKKKAIFFMLNIQMLNILNSQVKLYNLRHQRKFSSSNKFYMNNSDNMSKIEDMLKKLQANVDLANKTRDQSLSADRIKMNESLFKSNSRTLLNLKDVADTHLSKEKIEIINKDSAQFNELLKSFTDKIQNLDKNDPQYTSKLFSLETRVRHMTHKHVDKHFDFIKDDIDDQLSLKATPDQKKFIMDFLSTEKKKKMIFLMKIKYLP